MVLFYFVLQQVAEKKNETSIVDRRASIVSSTQKRNETKKN